MAEIGWNDDSTGMSRSLLRSPIRAFNTANPSLKGYPPGMSSRPWNIYRARGWAAPSQLSRLIGYGC